ncbi:MAG: hypothetical protein VYC34_00755, partial [Planctomycetota bacterium]|nr:hypothetical protein [Planctomycetota bacterium]
QAQAEQQQGGGIFASLTSAPRNSAEQREQINIVGRILADPFGWLQRARDRITTIQTADNIAAVLIDNKPAFGLGLTMRLDDNGKWAIALPLNLPVVARYTPRNHDEWSIVASIIQVIDNALKDLTTDIKQGDCRTLAEASELAGEKAVSPMFIAIIAYNRAMEARERAASAP